MPTAEKFLRFTPYDTVSFEEIENLLQKLKIDTYVVSYEYEGVSRPHYHLYVETSYTNERLRYQCKKHINAEVYISQEDVRDKIRAIAYTIKDGNYRLKNIDINTFLMAKQVTHKKETFQSDIDKLKSSGENNKMIVCRAVKDLYIKHNKKMYMQHMEALCRTILATNDKTYAEDVVNQLYNKL